LAVAVIKVLHPDITPSGASEASDIMFPHHAHDPAGRPEHLSHQSVPVSPQPQTTKDVP
jgi:hypothetical protein